MLNMIAVAALSTGDASLLTGQVASALRDAKILVLRTGQHPVTGWLKAQGIAYETLDALYGQSEDFDAFNQAAVARILALSE
ncbi:MAG: MazG family protein, partial [Clostridia bacterium]|nr:MazG family protein [Clostridia bacterium]